MNFDDNFVFTFWNSFINIGHVILEPLSVYHSDVDENEKPSIKLILSIIPRRDKLNLSLAISLQSVIGVLDLIGVFLVGFIECTTNKLTSQSVSRGVGTYPIRIPFKYSVLAPAIVRILS